MQIYTLYHRFLKLLLPPLVLILLAGAVFAYRFALHAAMDAYDLGLLNEAMDLSNQIEMKSDRLAINLPLVAKQMLKQNNEDRESYAAWDGSGRLFAGSPKLLKLRGIRADKDNLFYTLDLDGRENRAIVFTGQFKGNPYFIAVSQTTRGRERLAESIFAGTLIPEALLAFMSIGIILWGVRIGLRPVNVLRDEIVKRTSNDLRPIEKSTALTELLPIIHGVNELLENLAASFASHRRFIADAAHQLRTPLASLSGQIEVALTTPPENMEDFLRQLLATAQRTTHLSNQLLSLARLEHTEQSMHEQTNVDLQQVFLDAAADFVTLAARKGIEIEFELKPIAVRGSPLMLRELLVNLLDNAVNYTPAEGRILVRLDADGSNVALSVENSGPPIPDRELRNLGTPFYRLPSAQPGGCGLGLAIVREIARLHSATATFGHGIDGGGLRTEMRFHAVQQALVAE
jgi:two-component system, OmpR family, sensor histidine kinase TctE